MGQRTNSRDRLYLWVTVVGFFLVFVISELTKLYAPFRPLLFLPVFAVPVAVLAIMPVVTLALWALQGDHERGSMVTAILGVGVLIMFMQSLAPTIGWWTGPVFSVPVIMQGFIYGIMATGAVAGLLGLYRLIARSRPGAALLLYGAVAVALIPIIIFVDRYAIQIGLISFHKSYTIFTDVLYGEAIILLPLLIYELLRRRERRS